MVYKRAFEPNLPANAYSQQWQYPRDVFSVLLLVGGDIVTRALAALAGNGFAPVAFSFGWVAFAVSALSLAVGENKLMPDPDCDVVVINGANGYVRSNTSWVIGRIVRDFGYWSRDNPSIDHAVQEIIDERYEDEKIAAANAGKSTPGRPPQAGLCISIFEAGDPNKMRVQQPDWVYLSGVCTMVLQFGIASIPCGLFGDWGILMITAAGTCLSTITGWLPQWGQEKWACRSKVSKNVIITRGNGSQHAIVVIGRGQCLDLEDLAAVSANVDVLTSKRTRFALVVLAILWVFLLITAAGTRHNTWFLLAVGGSGILQNAAVAGWRRRPENLGLPLVFKEVFAASTVMPALLGVEQAYPKIGASMRSFFFPGKLRPRDQQEWKVLELESMAIDAKANADKQEPDQTKAAEAASAAAAAQREAQEARNNFGERRPDKGGQRGLHIRRGKAQS